MRAVENLLLDRDGVINNLVPYGEEMVSPQNLEDFEFIKGSKQALREINRKDISIYIITNQPDVSKSWRPLDMPRLREINKMLKQNGVKEVYSCTHGPKGNRHRSTYTDTEGSIITCGCRKPQPGLIENCFQENSIKAERTIIVGDKLTDMEAAARFEAKRDEKFLSKVRVGGDEGLCDKKFSTLRQFTDEEL